MAKITDNFRDWACSFSGCNGGNENADTWICGIEWGGASANESAYYKEQLPREIETGEIDHATDKYNWEEHITYRYGISVAKLYAAINGQKVNDYKKLINEKVWNGSELFKLNLYPIAFDSTNSELWKKNGLKEITGFDEKHLFQTWCMHNRFPKFSERRKELKPKLIICTGIGYLRDFFLCFGGDKSNADRIEYDEFMPSSETNRKHPRRYYWVKLDEDTTLVVIPFFSGSYGLNSNYLLQEMGERISKICQDNS